MSNVNELLREHVTLEVECLDRIYLNGYVPNLQVGGQLVNFLTKHLGNKIPSPALLGKRGAAYRQAVKDFAKANEIFRNVKENIGIILFDIDGEAELFIIPYSLPPFVPPETVLPVIIGEADEFAIP